MKNITAEILTGIADLNQHIAWPIVSNVYTVLNFVYINFVSSIQILQFLVHVSLTLPLTNSYNVNFQRLQSKLYEEGIQDSHH